MRRQRRRTLLALMLCGAALTAALAATSGDSAPVTRLGTGGHQIFGYQLTTDARGAATIVLSTAKFVGDTAESLIRVTQQNAKGTWSAPTQLGALHQSLNPVMAESAFGAAVIVWSWVQGGPRERSVIEAVTRSSTQARWSTPQTLWSSAEVTNALPAVGINSGGVATVVWSDYGPADPTIWSTSINTTDPTVTTPHKLIAAGAGGTDVSLTVNGAGAALLSWQRQVGLTRSKHSLPTVHAAEMVDFCPAHGHWLPPHRLSSFSFQQEPVGTEIWGPSPPSITVTAYGTAAATWLAGDRGNGARLDIATRNPLTGTWSPPHTLDPATAFDPAIAPGSRGGLLALWSSNDEGTLETATRAEGSQWSVAHHLSGRQDGSGPSLASDPDGNDVIATAGRRSRILFSTRTGPHDWSTPRIAGTGFNPEVTVSVNGSITLAWEQPETAGGALETRTYP
jgi:hypothetical protein